MEPLNLLLTTLKYYRKAPLYDNHFKINFTYCGYAKK